MKRFASALAAALILMAAAVPARADCAADIKKAEAALVKLPSNEKTSQKLAKIEKMIGKSKKLLANKKKKKCKNVIKKAMNMADKIKAKVKKKTASQPSCADDIKKAEGLMKELPTDRPVLRNTRKILDFVKQAKEHLSNNKKKDCKKTMKKALQIATAIKNKQN